LSFGSFQYDDLIRQFPNSLIYHFQAFFMVSLHPPVCDFNWPAVDFCLPGVDGRTWSLANCMGEKGLLVMFICNHCPYVQAILDRIIRDTRELQPLGINSVAIMPNDTVAYPEDAFDKMQALAEHKQFNFPYLWDESQAIARAYGAVCTPDFFGFNAAGDLQYRGRLDASGKQAADAAVQRDLFLAMQQVATTQRGPDVQVPSIGCSIKWH
jgi:peroxiredoxin